MRVCERTIFGSRVSLLQSPSDSVHMCTTDLLFYACRDYLYNGYYINSVDSSNYHTARGFNYHQGPVSSNTAVCVGVAMDGDSWALGMVVGGEPLVSLV